MTDDPKVRLVHISGKVQGVSFRIWTKTQAQRLGLTGWVRNEDDGSVTALIAGQDAAVSRMLKQFWNGPVGASVSRVVSEQASLDEAPTDFRITR
ncbi:acylphosphatase (plasmid) [Rhizobium etli 8C-3]|uniref:Acylphosphatase n=2 Tax=Rhizobium TaxID=379 RepID=A0A4V2VFL3_9HYPH|nr:MULTISPECIES: acylphosphatase [Rhizobium]APO78116.1 acylphosphatase [Rhizobium etli 8C-3]TCU31072.1 acylphosphatase [Rhizobium azibense]TCU40905.1 acylphosphatase [Rhizobium azibense]